MTGARSKRQNKKTIQQKHTPREFFRPSLTYPEWEKAFLKEPKAQESLEKILSGTADSHAPQSSAVIRQDLECNVLQFLYEYWSISDTGTQKTARQLLALIESLPQVERAARSLVDKVEHLHGDAGLFVGYPHREIARDLRVYAEQLAELSASWKRHKRKLGPRNIKRSFEIIRLIHHVNYLTGQQHFADLATLINCALNAHGSPANVSAPDEDALRHLYTRFNSRNPGLLDAITKAALH